MTFAHSTWLQAGRDNGLAIEFTVLIILSMFLVINTVLPTLTQCFFFQMRQDL